MAHDPMRGEKVEAAKDRARGTWSEREYRTKTTTVMLSPLERELADKKRDLALEITANGLETLGIVEPVFCNSAAALVRVKQGEYFQASLSMSFACAGFAGDPLKPVKLAINTTKIAEKARVVAELTEKVRQAKAACPLEKVATKVNQVIEDRFSRTAAANAKEAAKTEGKARAATREAGQAEGAARTATKEAGKAEGAARTATKEAGEAESLARRMNAYHTRVGKCELEVKKAEALYKPDSPQARWARSELEACKKTMPKK